MRTTLLVAALAATAVAAPAFAQQAAALTAQDQATARGTVLGSYSLIKSRNLDFGVVSVGTTTGGDVIVDPTDAAVARVPNGSGVTILGGTSSSARFDGTGAPNETVSLALSGAGTTSVVDGSGHSIPVVLALDAGNAGDPNTRVADSNGSFTAWVGGTFTIAAGQTPGVYSNVFYLTATYQ